MKKERKWELVSTLQKSIRRGDKDVAFRVVSAIANFPEEYAYFWKRLCVIACEDVGPADDLLTTFVVACSTIFTPKKSQGRTYDLFCFLVEQMCDLPARSRIYCSFGIIESILGSGLPPDSSLTNEPIVSSIVLRKAEMADPSNSWHEWQRKNDWRAENLLRFVDLRLPMEMTRVELPIPTYRSLHGLPSYCYDMHTRVGKEMLGRLVCGGEGAEVIQSFVRQNKVREANKAVGFALFFVEGGRIQSELAYVSLSELEQRLVAQTHGLSPNQWQHLLNCVQETVERGVIDNVRENILNQLYGLEDEVEFTAVRAEVERNSTLPLFPLGM